MNTPSLILTTCLPFLACETGCSPKHAPTVAPNSASPASITRPWRSPDLTSNLNIPAQQRFIFAGEQSEPFVAFVTNRGSVPVQIVAELEGVTKPIVTVEPGQKVSHRFDARQSAVFENPSNEQANLLVEVWGQTEVGMRYRPMMTESKGN
jgi:hypothetical protein